MVMDPKLWFNLYTVLSLKMLTISVDYTAPEPP